MKKKRGNWTEQIGEFEVRYQDGEIDEIVGPNFHLEFMNYNSCWIGMGRVRRGKYRGGPSIHVNFWAKTKLHMLAEKNY